MSCYLHYRHEYRGGFVIQGKEFHTRTSAQELDQYVEWLKKRGIPYTVDGLTLTYDNVQGTTEDLHFTVTLTWTDRDTEKAR